MFQLQINISANAPAWVTSGLKEVQHRCGIPCSHLFCRPMNEPALESADKGFVEQSRAESCKDANGTQTRDLYRIFI